MSFTNNVFLLFIPQETHRKFETRNNGQSEVYDFDD